MRLLNTATAAGVPVQLTASMVMQQLQLACPPLSPRLHLSAPACFWSGGPAEQPNTPRAYKECADRAAGHAGGANRGDAAGGTLLLLLLLNQLFQAYGCPAAGKSQCGLGTSVPETLGGLQSAYLLCSWVGFTGTS